MGSLRCPTNRQSAASKVADVHTQIESCTAHNAEGTFPGLGESLVCERATRGAPSAGRLRGDDGDGCDRNCG
jgi:hypothetical protein